MAKRRLLGFPQWRMPLSLAVIDGGHDVLRTPGRRYKRARIWPMSTSG